MQIEKPLKSYHQHNEHKILEELISSLSSGKNIALISDAGTPVISDPGFLLIREAISNNISVISLPGATAFVPALVHSGMPCNEFSFYGFLPQKKGRQTRLKLLAQEEKTFIVYESRFRLLKLLEEFKTYLGGKPWELYDLKTDRTELHDLASQHPERVAAMAKVFEAWQKN